MGFFSCMSAYIFNFKLKFNYRPQRIHYNMVMFLCEFLFFFLCSDSLSQILPHIFPQRISICDSFCYSNEFSQIHSFGPQPSLFPSSHIHSKIFSCDCDPWLTEFHLFLNPYDSCSFNSHITTKSQIQGNQNRSHS